MLNAEEKRIPGLQNSWRGTCSRSYCGVALFGQEQVVVGLVHNISGEGVGWKCRDSNPALFRAYFQYAEKASIG